MPARPNRRARFEIDRCEPQRSAIASGKIDFQALTKGHYPGTPVARNILPGLNHIGFWNAAGKPDWGLDAHRNEGVEIMFLETGTMDFMVDGQSFRLRAGNFTITRPWQLHKLGAPHIGPGRLHWLILDVGVRQPRQQWRWPEWLLLTAPDLAELTGRIRGHEQPVWLATPAIKNIFGELARGVANWGQPQSVSRMTANLNLLFLEILSALGSQQSAENSSQNQHQQAVEIFLRDLEAGVVNVGEPWTLRRMAAHCGMGVTTFSKYCREIFNAGPVEFLNQCRLDRAAAEIRSSPPLPITDIAFKYGFNSSQYFATTFHKRHGASPSAYRANASATKAGLRKI
jgi:AraC-like DNA-binding protein/mannose-6-phosphate isomerase-like protein (cupin superfamily)